MEFSLFSSSLSFLVCTCGIWKFPGQGANLSHSCDLQHNCVNTGPWTHCTTAGTPAWNPVLYTTVWITSSHLTVGGTKLTSVPNTSPCPPNTPQMHPLAQAPEEGSVFRVCFYCFLVFSSLAPPAGSSGSAEVPWAALRAGGWAPWRCSSQAQLPKLAGKCSFVSRSSSPETLPSWGKSPQLSRGPQRDFVPLIPVTDPARVLWSRLVCTRKQSPSSETSKLFPLHQFMKHIINFPSIIIDRGLLEERHVLINTEKRSPQQEAVTFHKAKFCLVRTLEMSTWSWCGRREQEAELSLPPFPTVLLMFLGGVGDLYYHLEGSGNETE